MQLRCMKRSSISVLLTGIIVLTLAACSVESDVPVPSAEVEQDIVSLIWNSPASVTEKANVEFDKALQENPDMTLEEETAVLRQILVRLNKQVSESSSELSPFQYSDWNRLTPEEKKLCSSAPPACNKTREYKNEALQYSIEREPIGPRLGPQDAFRHAYWNSAMCSRISRSWADRFATAHESESPDNAEREMDFYNNDVGREICTDRRIALTMSRAVDAGDLKIVVGGPDGRLVDSDQPWSP